MKKFWWVLVLLLPGCGASTYDQYLGAYTAHVKAESTRISAQATAIEESVYMFDGTKTEKALLTAFSMMAIGQLQPVPFTLEKPTQWEDVGMTLAGQATNLMGYGMMGFVAKWGIESAGHNFGRDTVLQNSLNHQRAFSRDGAIDMQGMTPGPEPVIVRPEVVRP